MPTLVNVTPPTVQTAKLTLFGTEVSSQCSPIWAGSNVTLLTAVPRDLTVKVYVPGSRAPRSKKYSLRIITCMQPPVYCSVVKSTDRSLPCRVTEPALATRSQAEGRVRLPRANVWPPELQTRTATIWGLSVQGTHVSF